VLEIEESRYAAAAQETWIPAADPKDPRTVWNARAELLRIVGTVTRLTRPAVFVETGVALGFTTATILRAMAENDSGHVYSLDLPALQYDPDDPIGRAIPDDLKGRWTLRLGDSRKTLGPLCAEIGPLDIFLHDALHTYTSQLREYTTAWPHIRSGGLLISDDVNNPAFVEFADSVSVRPHLIAGPSRADVVGLIRKP
jgi:predicted O-methyltransferase YrrM